MLPRHALGADAGIDFVHFWPGADHPVQKVIRASNEKNAGITVTSRQDGITYETIAQRAMASIAADAARR